MAGSDKDPTAPIRAKASCFPDVAEGASCSQTSFKASGKAFLFVGMQGGRCKVMVKLRQSMPEATQLARKDPDCFEVGSTGWVTARFTAEKPLPRKLWDKWLDESYEIARAAGPKKKAAKKKDPKKRTTMKRLAKSAEPKTGQK